MAKNKKPTKPKKKKPSKQQKAIMDRFHLTFKQLLFADAYIESLNATYSAGVAGYSGGDNALAVIGNRNLRNTKIKKYIAEMLSDEAMSAGEVLTRLAQQVRFNPFDCVKKIREVKTKDGVVMVFDWDLDALKRKGHMVRSFKQTQYGPHLTFADPQKALELQGKFHVLFTDKLQIDSVELEIIQAIQDKGSSLYPWLVEKGGSDLAERLFRQAGVEIGGSE